MTLHFDQVNDGGLYFTSPHWVHLPVVDARHMIVITGAVKFDFVYQGGAEWHTERLSLALAFPPILPPNKWFYIEHWAPFVTINAINKGGDNHNGGWAVWDFGLEHAYLNGMVKDRIGIWADIRVRGAEFRVVRFGYTLTVSGTFGDQPSTWPHPK